MISPRGNCFGEEPESASTEASLLNSFEDSHSNSAVINSNIVLESIINTKEWSVMSLLHCRDNL